MKLDLKALAKLGIESRLKELNNEIQVLNEAYESLKDTPVKPEVKTRTRKKLHWTQTPKGRKHMSKLQKLRWKNKIQE